MATPPRSTLAALSIGLILVAQFRAAQAQPDSAAAAARHDPEALMQLLRELENEEQVRVEVPRNLLDLESSTRKQGKACCKAKRDQLSPRPYRRNWTHRGSEA